MPYDYSALQGYYGTQDPTKGLGTTGTGKTPAGAVKPLEPTEYSPPFGGKPSVPDPADILKSTIGANLGMMPDIKGLGRKASNYFWNQTVGRVPGYENMAAQSAKNIGSFLRGEVPADVLYQIGQGAAERGISRGGGFSNADYLRSLGLTSLGLMGEGEKGLTGALQRAESVPLFDISKYMLNPQDVYQSNLLASIYAAAPNPAAAANLAKSAVTGGSKTTPGVIGGMPAIGGTKLTPGGTPAVFNQWGSEWAPYGDVSPPGVEINTPSATVYNPWGPSGWMGGGPVSGPSTGPQYPTTDTYVDWNDPYLQDLLGGGAEEGSYSAMLSPDAPAGAVDTYLYGE